LGNVTVIIYKNKSKNKNNNIDKEKHTVENKKSG
jgi:hypothetical protein